MTCEILEGDCRETLRSLPDASVHCVVTSPPYYGLRSYDTARWEGGDPSCTHDVRRWEGEKQTQGAQSGHPAKRDRLDRQQCACGARRVDRQIGLEESLADYLDQLAGVFREVWRVLRPDGTLWVNMGDSYACSPNGRKAKDIENDDRTFRDKPFSTARPGGRTGDGGARRGANRNGGPCPQGLKPKNLLGQPWRLAFRLQEEGWILRSDIIWAKPNPLPESVSDRPTKSHEYLFLFSKQERYFYDSDAIREPHSEESLVRAGRNWNGERQRDLPGSPQTLRMGADQQMCHPAGRNKRTVWTITPEAYGGEHYATYPRALVEPCVLAGSSSYGVCHCGAPWKRVVEKESQQKQKAWSGAGRNNGCVAAAGHAGRTGQWSATVETTGWEPTCKCANPARQPAVILDPFAGTGTTAVVALSLGRRAILCELSPRYVKQIHKRLAKVQLPLPETLPF